MTDNEIAKVVVDSAIEVHRMLGTVAYNNIFESQALTYLRLSNLQLALVINFGETHVRRGIHRVVNGLRD